MSYNDTSNGIRDVYQSIIKIGHQPDLINLNKMDKVEKHREYSLSRQRKNQEERLRDKLETLKNTNPIK